MNFVETKIYRNEKGEVEWIKVKCSKKAEKVSEYKMKIGSKLVVNQMNKQAKKNRGREVGVLGFPERASDNDHKVSLDTNRPEIVEISDLDTIN